MTKKQFGELLDEKQKCRPNRNKLAVESAAAVLTDVRLPVCVFKTALPRTDAPGCIKYSSEGKAKCG